MVDHLDPPDTPALTVRCFRPAGILSTGTHPALALLAAPISVRVDRLAVALVAVATGRRRDVPAIVSNRTVKEIARRATRVAARVQRAMP